MYDVLNSMLEALLDGLYDAVINMATGVYSGLTAPFLTLRRVSLLFCLPLRCSPFSLTSITPRRTMR